MKQLPLYGGAKEREMRTRQMIERLWRLADEGDLAAERELGALLRRAGDLEGLAMLGDEAAAEALAKTGNLIWDAMLPPYLIGIKNILRCFRDRANYPAWIAALEINTKHMSMVFRVAYQMPHLSNLSERIRGKHALRVRCVTRTMCGAIMFEQPKIWRSEITFGRCGAEGVGPIDWSSHSTAATSARVARLAAAQWLSQQLEQTPRGR